MKTFFAWKPALALPALASAILVVLAGVSLYVYQQRGPSTTEQPPVIVRQPTLPENTDGLFALTALQQDATGIEPETRFKLTSKIQTTLDQIRESFRLTPNIAFAVETADGGYLITPEQNLLGNTMVSAAMAVTFTADDGSTKKRTYEWAFQVKEKFQVVETLPRHKGTSVPLDTGIEITFSHLGAEGVEQHITIQPQTAGRFETHRKTVVFVPDKALTPHTLYTLTIGQKIRLPETGETLGKDVVIQFETADTSASNDVDKNPFRGLSQKTMESSSQEPLTILVNGSGLNDKTQLKTVFYRFKDQASYLSAFKELASIPLWANTAQSFWQMPTDGLDQAIAVDLVPQTLGEWGWQQVITMPEPTTSGYYLIDVSYQDRHFQALAVISDLTAYATVSETQTVVWVHDAKSKATVNGASVKLSDGTTLGSTSDRGLLSVATPETMLNQLETSMVEFIIASDGQELVIPFSGNVQGNTAFEPYRSRESKFRVLPFWSYLYIDQPIYRPGDTLNFFGVLNERGKQNIEKSTVRLMSGYDWNNSLEKIMEQPATIGKFGTFEGQMAMPKLLPGTYQLELAVNDKAITRQSVRVETFFKPAYMIDINPKIIGVLDGDDLTHTVTAKFFEGTPVAKLNLNVNSQTLTTNAMGVAEYSTTYHSGTRNDYGNEELIEATAVKGEESDIFSQARVRVFPGSLFMDATGEEEAPLKAKVNGGVYHFDLDAYNRQGDLYGQPEGKPAGQRAITLSVKRRWYTKTEAGQTYDFIRKKAIPRYDYQYHEESMGTQETTSNAEGQFSFSFPMIEESSYDGILSVKDDAGRTIEDQIWISPNLEGSYGDENANYFWMKDETKGAAKTARTNYDLGEEKSIGDEVRVTMSRGSNALESGENRFLFVEAREGIRKSVVNRDASYSFTFSEEHVPNIYVQGVWFDGRSYWTTDVSSGMFRGNNSFSFKEKDRELDIAVKPEQEQYGPGDEATLNISVKNPNGDGVQAVVNVNLIDEALYALGYFGEQTGFLKEYYKDALSGIYFSYASHRYPLALNAAEGGGGGGEARIFFPDKALFRTVSTDASGQARVSFKLPDNLTSWRVTTHAIDAKNEVGNDVSALIVKQPFFVDAVLNHEYLEGDRVIMAVRTYGEGINDQTPVELTVSSKTLDMAEVGLSTTGYKSNDITLPPLTSGKHEVLIRAKAGKQEDAIVRTFVVVPSRMAIEEVDVEEAKVGWKPQVETDRPITVTFADDQLGQYYPALSAMAYDVGDRLDEQLGRWISATILNERFGEDLPLNEINAAAYQTERIRYDGPSGGGLTLFPYSDNDLLISAHSANSSAGAMFDVVALEEYFDQILNDEKETTLRRSQAAYGLAGLRAPVLVEIRVMLASDKIDDEDRLYLALGLAALGDHDGASAVFNDLAGRYGKTLDQSKMLEWGDSKDEQVEHTLLMAMLASRIETEDADLYMNFVEAEQTKDTIIPLQKAGFIESRLEYLPATPVKMNIRHLGENQTIELANGETQSIVLTDQSLSEFELQSVEGSASAILHYQRPAAENELKTSDLLSITRTIDPVSISEGDLVKITLSVDIQAAAPDGAYQITDMLPAGLQAVTQSYRRNFMWNNQPDFTYPHTVDGQRVSFRIYETRKSLSYFARVMSKGEYAAEPAILQSMEAPSIRSASEKTRITIE